LVVLTLVFVPQDMSDLEAAAVLRMEVFGIRQSISPGRVGYSIVLMPDVVVGGVDDARNIADRPGCAERRSVRVLRHTVVRADVEHPAGVRLVTRSASDFPGLSRLAKPAVLTVITSYDWAANGFLKKEHLTQTRGPRVITKRIRRIGSRHLRQWRKRLDNSPLRPVARGFLQGGISPDKTRSSKREHQRAIDNPGCGQDLVSELKGLHHHCPPLKAN